VFVRTVWMSPNHSLMVQLEYNSTTALLDQLFIACIKWFSTHILSFLLFEDNLAIMKRKTI